MKNRLQAACLAGVFAFAVGVAPVLAADEATPPPPAQTDQKKDDQTSQDAGESGAKKAGEDVADGAKQAGEDVAHGFKKFGRDVGDFFRGLFGTDD